MLLRQRHCNCRIVLSNAYLHNKFIKKKIKHIPFLCYYPSNHNHRMSLYYFFTLNFFFAFCFFILWLLHLASNKEFEAVIYSYIQLQNEIKIFINITRQPYCIRMHSQHIQICDIRQCIGLHNFKWEITFLFRYKWIVETKFLKNY